MLPAIIGGAFSIAGGIMGAASAKKAATAARDQRKKLEAKAGYYKSICKHGKLIRYGFRYFG